MLGLSRDAHTAHQPLSLVDLRIAAACSPFSLDNCKSELRAHGPAGLLHVPAGPPTFLAARPTVLAYRSLAREAEKGCDSMAQRNAKSTGEALDRVRDLLNQNRAEEAADSVVRFGLGNIELINAYGVCLIRAGHVDKALETYRNLCLDSNGVTLKANVPSVPVANFATALLLKGNVRGCLETLAHVRDGADPPITRVREAVERWKRSLGVLQRAKVAMFGEVPAGSVSLGFPPGELMQEQKAELADAEVKPARK